jgi:glycosyltransferase involved in cell wall biosynthesis
MVHFARVFRSLLRGRPHILDSTSGRWHPDLLALAAVSLLRRTPRAPVVLMGAMWEPDAGLHGAVQRFLVRRADRTIALYALQSSEELETFPVAWGVRRDKLRVVPYFFTIKDEDLPRGPAVESAPPYVFSGGDSHRAYAPLIDAARRLPEVPFVLGTRLFDGVGGLPANVTARELPHLEFMRALTGAATVVIPLSPGLRRAAGQQTYLNAMWLGKPTIVTDAPAVRDHLKSGETALVVPATADALRDALEWALQAPEAHVMALAGQRDVRARFTFERHAEAVLAVLDEALAPRGVPEDAA